MNGRIQAAIRAACESSRDGVVVNIHRNGGQYAAAENAGFRFCGQIVAAVVNGVERQIVIFVGNAVDIGSAEFRRLRILALQRMDGIQHLGACVLNTGVLHISGKARVSYNGQNGQNGNADHQFYQRETALHCFLDKSIHITTCVKFKNMAYADASNFNANPANNAHYNGFNSRPRSKSRLSDSLICGNEKGKL